MKSLSVGLNPYQKEQEAYKQEQRQAQFDYSVEELKKKLSVKVLRKVVVLIVK